ncbi:MAG: hypothetical protein ABIM36_02640 [candidate division WOR-3 bacterium]
MKIFLILFICIEPNLKKDPNLKKYRKYFGVPSTGKNIFELQPVIIDSSPNQYTLWETAHDPICVNYNLIGIAYRRREPSHPGTGWIGYAYSNNGTTWIRSPIINPLTGEDYPGRYPHSCITPSYCVSTWSVPISGVWGREAGNSMSRSTGNWNIDRLLSINLGISYATPLYLPDGNILVLGSGYDEQNNIGFTYAQKFNPANMQPVDSIRPVISLSEGIYAGSDIDGNKIAVFYKAPGGIFEGEQVLMARSLDGGNTWEGPLLVGKLPPDTMWMEGNWLYYCWYQFWVGGEGIFLPDGTPVFFGVGEMWGTMTDTSTGITLPIYGGGNIYMLKGGTCVNLTNDSDIDTPILRCHVGVSINRSANIISIVWQELTQIDVNIGYGYWDIFGMSSFNGGNTWTEKIQITNTPLFNDNLPHVARNIWENSLHIIYGTSYNGVNDLVYESESQNEIKIKIFYLKTGIPGYKVEEKIVLDDKYRKYEKNMFRKIEFKLNKKWEIINIAGQKLKNPKEGVYFLNFRNKYKKILILP